MTDHFEDLIQTIESNAVNNQITITNVKLWADSWREEREMDIRNNSIPYELINNGKESN